MSKVCLVSLFKSGSLFTQIIQANIFKTMYWFFYKLSISFITTTNILLWSLNLGNVRGVWCRQLIGASFSVDDNRPRQDCIDKAGRIGHIWKRGIWPWLLALSREVPCSCLSQTGTTWFPGRGVSLPGGRGVGRWNHGGLEQETARTFWLMDAQASGGIAALCTLWSPWIMWVPWGTEWGLASLS